MEGKYEARVKGPHITPGYWRQPELTAQAFDEEGYYRLGDAFVFADDRKPEAGLLFRGRIAEDFKLDERHLGARRAAARAVHRALRAARARRGDRRRRARRGRRPGFSCSQDDPERALPSASDAFAGQSTGSSNRITRAIVLEEPPSLDAGEMTDKGSINQRAVLARRAALVEELYRDPPSARTICA